MSKLTREQRAEYVLGRLDVAGPDIQRLILVEMVIRLPTIAAEILDRLGRDLPAPAGDRAAGIAAAAVLAAAGGRIAGARK